MEPSKKSNKKWIIFGALILALAIIIAVGPILISKYMGTKTTPQQRTIRSEMMIKVKGTIKQAQDKTVYLYGENGMYYVLVGDLVGEISKNLGQKATVFGNIVIAKDETIDGNPVRMKISVVNFGIPDIGSSQEVSAEINRIKKKVEDKAKLKKEISAITPIGSSDFVRGKPVKETRYNNVVYTLVDEFGDTYVLADDFSNLVGQELLIIGKETVPQNNYPLKKDEITFSVERVFDATNYKRIR